MEESVKFECMAAYSKGEKLKHFAYTPRPLGPNDVEIKIAYCGMCGSDIHQINSEWGQTIYPIVPGHEIIGEVTVVGGEVKKFVKGMRVGVGAQCLSCNTCTDCHRHEEQLCQKKVWTYNDRYSDGEVAYGGYAKYVRCDSKFVFKIPDNLPSEGASPLLCAGITTFSPMKHYGIGKGSHVGIMVIGGLGHLAIKIGRALGAHVTAISSKTDKTKLAKELGAENFICSSDLAQMKLSKRTLDAIITTVSGGVESWSPFFELIKPDGKFIFLGLPEEKLHIKSLDFIPTRISLCGSIIGSPQDIEEMLKLCSENNIVAMTKCYPLENVNEALKDLEDGKPQFRNVLKITHN